MIYTELKTILDRDLSIASSEPESNDYSKLIDVLVDYSTNLLSRSIDQNKGETEVLVANYLFQHIFELADSISIQIKNSIVKPAYLQLRSMYEALNELIYLLDGDKEKRARCYVYCQTQKELEISETFNKGSKKLEKIQKSIDDDILLAQLVLPTFPEVKDQIAEYKRILSQEKYKEIEKEYNDRKRKRKKFKWYSMFDGPNNIFELAKEIKTRGVYEIAFRYLSKKVHVDEFESFYKYKDSILTIERIRKFDNGGMVALYSISFLLKSIMLITDKYRPLENEQFAKYYKKYIQSEFQAIVI